MRALSAASAELDARHARRQRGEAADRQQVGAAEEFRRKPVRRIAIERLRVAERDELAVAHDADVIGERQRLGLVVRDVQHRQRRQVAMQAGELVQHRAADLRVERRQRLVEQQHLRADRQCAGDRHALLLAAGQLARIASRVVRHAHHAQAFGHALADELRRRAARAQAERDVFLRAHVREQRVVLHDHADVAGVRREVGDVARADGDAPARRPHEACHRAQRRGLAGARWPDQRDDLAGLDGERQRLEHDLRRRRRR